MSPAEPCFGEPDTYPPEAWVYAPQFLARHPKPAILSMDAQASLIAAMAAMETSPRLFAVLVVPGRLLAVWERATAPFRILCHRLGHNPAAAVGIEPTRTIYRHV